MISLFPFEETKSVNDEINPQSKLIMVDLAGPQKSYLSNSLVWLLVECSSYPSQHVEGIGIIKVA